MQNYRTLIKKRHYQEIIDNIRKQVDDHTSDRDAALPDSDNFYRCQDAAAQHLSWLNEWSEHLSQLHKLDSEFDRAQREYNDALNARDRARDKPKPYIKAATATTGAGILALLVFHDVLWLYVVTAVAALVAVAAVGRLMQTGGEDPPEVQLKQQEMHNVRQAKEKLIEEINESRPSTVLVDS